MRTPTLPTLSTRPIHALDVDQLRDRLAETVELLNAATDPGERVGLHFDAEELRAAIAKLDGVSTG